MKIEDMEKLIDSLKDFKDELSNSNSRRNVNIVMRLIQGVIDELHYYRNEEE